MTRILVDRTSDTPTFREALRRKNPDAEIVECGRASFGATPPVAPSSTASARTNGEQKARSDDYHGGPWV